MALSAKRSERGTEQLPFQLRRLCIAFADASWGRISLAAVRAHLGGQSVEAFRETPQVEVGEVSGEGTDVYAGSPPEVSIMRRGHKTHTKCRPI